MTDGQIISVQKFNKWNATTLGEVGRWHEAQARALEDYMRLGGGSPLHAANEALRRDIEFHRRAATALLEAQ